MMSPRQIPDDRGSTGTGSLRHTPLQIIHVVGYFMRIWSIYSLYQYLTQKETSVVLFIFSCMVPSSLLFLALQKPWKGRALSNTQVVPSIINGGITALYFILWGKGLKACGPVRAILAEYSGAILGVLSAVFYGRRGHLWKKNIPSTERLDGETRTEHALGMKEMLVPIFAGILSALRRVIARRVSLKGSSSDSSMELPCFSWALLSTILFGIILTFYIDSIAEERLHMVFSSPRHLMVTGGCIIVMEMMFKTDFSLLGIYEATSLDRTKKHSSQISDLSDGPLVDRVQMSSLPT
ncbi:hypothetical protein RJ641_006535 [Dillenia turbinata]|uniref:Uncharacterized protein n=1 Tax=Dillenia turbinata TaxID=194707 RepID=A0AAN8Z667_9MAGN